MRGSGALASSRALAVEPSPRGRPYACIDVGSNTTRLLVAEERDGAVHELFARRAFTRIGRSPGGRGRIPDAKIREAAEVVAVQAELARRLGAGEIAVVATAAIREAPNGCDLAAAVERRAGLPVRILASREEAELAFLGATHALATRPQGHVAVVDVGGGSSEIAAGTVAEGMTWTESLPVGSGVLADAYFASDPPARGELEAARAHASSACEALRAPAVTQALGVGGSASSLRRVAGAELDAAGMERVIAALASAPRAEVARRFGLDPERVRLLPAGILILEAVSGCLGHRLELANGGLREGVILRMARLRA
jgi:exopolyphosphatase/guanosine-5'-triphosphate,3'-diphosphate pyrophosphatase